MNSKADLKLAREAIGAKKYGEAIRACKRVLMWESGNYNALVFLGVAHANLDEDEDAEESYKRAIEINDTQMLAWQGLLSFYEKRGRYKDVVNTINHLLPRVVKSGEGNRLADYLNKLLDIYGSKEKDEEKEANTMI